MLSSPLLHRLQYIERESIPWLDIFHACAVARDYQINAAPQSYTQLFIAYILSSIGGTLITAILLGQPVGWLTNDLTLSVYAIIFCFAFLPGTREIFRAVVNQPVIRTIVTLFDDASVGNAVATFGVQRALHPFHSHTPVKTSAIASVLCGITSGCGGGIMRSMFNFNNSTWSFTTPRHFSNPHWPMQFTAFLSVLYYVLVNPHSYLPYHGIDMNHGKLVLMVLCMVMNTGWNTVVGVMKSARVSENVAVKGVSKKEKKVIEMIPQTAATTSTKKTGNSKYSSSSSVSTTTLGEDSDAAPSGDESESESINKPSSRPSSSTTTAQRRKSAGTGTGTGGKKSSKAL